MKSAFVIDNDFRPMNDGWEDFDPNDQQNVAGAVMDVLHDMIENALADIRVHVPTDECGIVVCQDTQDIYIVARGRRVWESKLDMFALQPTVSSRFVVWPLPAPMIFGLE
jgi:hypothetical protein